MDAKTIVAVVLVAFIVAGFIFLQIKNRIESTLLSTVSLLFISTSIKKNGRSF